MTLSVIFDMDGLMLDTERIARQAWRQALAEHGVEIDDTTYLMIVGRTVKDAAQILAEVYGLDFPFERVYASRSSYYEAILAESGVPVKPGLVELLAYLEENDIPKAVASSTGRKFADYKLSGAGVLGRFKVTVCGDEVTYGKPAPDLFLQAASFLGVQPETCVVLEDSEAGIRAAHAARMIPVMIPDLKQPEPEVASLVYRVLPSLYEVIPLLQEFKRSGLPRMEQPNRHI